MRLYEIIDRMLERINEDDSGWASVAGKVSDAIIDQAESRIGVKFPTQYREFLKHYGAIQIGDLCLYGIWGTDEKEEGGGTVVWETRYAREKYKLPQKYVVIESDTFMWMVVLDCESGKIFEYHTSREEICASIEATFNEYLMRFVIGKLPGDEWPPNVDFLGLTENEKLLYVSRRE